MKVTQYERQVKTNPVSGHRLSLPEDTFGQSIAKGLGDIGTAFGGIAKDMKLQADTTRFTEAKEQLRKLQQDRFYGKDGYKSRQGANAMGLAKEIEENFDKDYEKVAGNLQNESQRRMFREWAREQYLPSLRQSGIEHEFLQIKAHQDAVDVGNLNGLMESAVFSCYDTAMFSENIREFDAGLASLADKLGLTGEARANFIKTNRSALSVGVIQKMLTDTPDNPQAAQKFFQQALKEGRIDAKGYQEVQKVLKPAVDNAYASVKVKTISQEVIAANTDDDPNLYGKPVMGFGAKAKEVLNATDIPEHLKTKIIQGLAANEKAINASRAEAYAQNYSKVLSQVQKGVPVASAEGYELLRPEDRNKLSWRAAGHSDAQAWSQLKTLQMNGQLTVADVNAAIGQLSETDYRSFYQAAAGGAAGAGSGNSIDDKFIDRNLQLALSRVGVNDAFKSGYKSKQEYAEYRYYVTEKVSEWRKQNPNQQLTMEQFSKIVNETHRYIAADDGWVWDSRYNYRGIRAENDALRAQGLPPNDGSLESLILYDDKGDALSNSKKVVDRISAQFGDVALYPDDIVRYWVRLQQTPQAYKQFMTNIK